MYLTAYHGTQYYFDNYNILEGMGQNTGNNAGAIFFTTNQDVAFSYSKEGFKSYHECDDIYYNNYNLLEEDAEKQAHLYKSKIDISNALKLDIKSIYNKEFYKKEGRTNILDAFLINHIINILQYRKYERYFEFYDTSKNDEALEFLSPYIEEYNAETDEYTEKNIKYDCIIIDNAIDSIDMDSHYVESTILIVLDESIIKTKNLIMYSETNENYRG